MVLSQDFFLSNIQSLRLQILQGHLKGAPLQGPLTGAPAAQQELDCSPTESPCHLQNFQNQLVIQ